MNHPQEVSQPQTSQISPERPTVNLLSAWSQDGTVAAARLAVDEEISAVELTQRINKYRAR